MRRIFLTLAVLGLIGLAAFYVLTIPRTIDPEEIAGLTGDVTRGEAVFYQGGCASCHSAPNAEGDEKLKLTGGRKFPSPFGTFFAPNISPDPVNGIGSWTTANLVNAMKFGTSPTGRHYFPAFPYTSYARVPVADMVDLKAFMDTLPAVDNPNQPHDVPFPFNIRRSLGGWKLLFLSGKPVVDAGDMTDEQLRGQRLAEGLGHCSECHTPRNILGGVIKSRWMGGAPNPEGKGKVPNLTPHKDGLAWSQSDIAEYLKSGFTPEFDTAGSLMADVIDNSAHWSDADRLAVGAYLKVLPEVAKKK